MRTVLVVGGAGYIGSVTVRRLLEKGYKVIVYDSLVKGFSESIPGHVKFVEGDLGDTEKLSEVLRVSSIDAVIHFAGFMVVNESINNPELYFENNVSKGLKFLSTLKKHAINKLVFSSSCAIYGVPDKVPITESTPHSPISPYGQTKLMFENILKTYDLAFGLKSVCLRYFNAAGAAYNIGEAHDPETHLVPLVLQVALGQRENISIFGTDYPTDDGTCIRDYVHVLDLADAHIAAIEYLFRGNPSNCFNIGTGKGSSVKEIIDVCREVTGHPIRALETVRRAGDPAKLVADVSKAKAILAWESKLGVKEIVQSAWNWHKNNPLGYKI
jgi:UDP-glucose 4-epimerase